MPASPQAASSAILERDGRFLLIRRTRPPSADLFAFPGGRAEPGETPDQTALRELREETGIAARNPVLFATYDLNGDRDDTRHFFLSVFRVEADEDIEAVANDDAADPGWYTVEEIRHLPVPASVLECAERLAAIQKDG
ncbi:NUDIX domain-containing protein [Neorhizobium sp. NCHU2750]|uniref:NUDIX hydrolase n=1 Tax=Neorhizobium sp. NCHU2750 TaxID=1825976 RepID=UPI000E740AA5|nr:ADP-ribose pyrophosphatase [Neorhizobium sp. NCHU2750]